MSAVLLCNMSQRKMLQSATGALFLLLHWFGGLALGEVGDFAPCLDFFYMRTPPGGIVADTYQPICQRYKNQYHFASLYNRQHRTPLFSAYTLAAALGRRPKSSWKYEPQVREERRRERNALTYVIAAIYYGIFGGLNIGANMPSIEILQHHSATFLIEVLTPKCKLNAAFALRLNGSLVFKRTKEDIKREK